MIKMEHECQQISHLREDELSDLAQLLQLELEHSCGRISDMVADARSQHIFNYTQGKLFNEQ